MAILKVLEILSNSTKSWEDATANAVKEASKSVKGISSVYVQDQSACVKNGKITEYRVNVKITFEIVRPARKKK
jgi:flavin-binding protein dodecin